MTTKKKQSKPGLIAPAGNWPMLRAAIEAGADAVYLGVNDLNMRITARNFEIQELKKVVQVCHSGGSDLASSSAAAGGVMAGTSSKNKIKNKVKVYLTLNTIVYEAEKKKIEKIIKEAKAAKVDAVICWDFFVIEQCIKNKIPFHISTQASVSNYDALKFYAKLGAEKAILARELSLEQIREIMRVALSIRRRGCQRTGNVRIENH